MIDPTDLLPSQLKAVNHMMNDDVRMLIWIAPTGVGKTYGICDAWVELAMYNAMHGYGNNKYAVAGVSASAVRRNVTEGLEDACRAFGIPFRDVGGPDGYFDIGGFAKFYIFGADNRKSYTKLRGLNLTGGWIDEATLCNEDFVQTLIGRCRMDNAKVVLTSNADSPYNFIKTEYMDRADGSQIVYMESEYDENRFIPQEQRDFIRANQTGHMYKRNIDNVWAPASGLVYPIEKYMITKQTKTYGGVCTIDWGGSGVFAALQFVKTITGWHIADEYYHDGTKQGVLPDNIHLEILRSRFAPNEYVIDPAAQGLMPMIRQMGYMVSNADNRIIPGIENVNNRLQMGKLTIDERCTHLLTETSAYIWNPLTDKPVKERDHLCDGMRYGAMHVLPMYAPPLMIGI